MVHLYLKFSPKADCAIKFQYKFHNIKFWASLFSGSWVATGGTSHLMHVGLHIVDLHLKFSPKADGAIKFQYKFHNIKFWGSLFSGSWVVTGRQTDDTANLIAAFLQFVAVNASRQESIILQKNLEILNKIRTKDTILIKIKHQCLKLMLR